MVLKPRFMRHTYKHHQHGGVLIMLILFMVVAFSTVLITGISTNKTTLARAEKTLEHLAEAKAAVIAYAKLSDPDKTPTGLKQRYLPCPDTDGDGLEETPCGTTSATGWLPWQTLGLPPLKDASGSCFRYYVSAEYKQGTSSPPLISALPTAEFSLNDPDQLLSNDIIAIIFAPNDVVAGQNRSISSGTVTKCGSTATSAPINQNQNLLDNIAGTNNATVPSFIIAPKSVTFNDVATWITSTELQ